MSGIFVRLQVFCLAGSSLGTISITFFALQLPIIPNISEPGFRTDLRLFWKYKFRGGGVKILDLSKV